MLEHAMPGEALQSNGVPGEHHLKHQAAAQNRPSNEALQEMAGKLDKSEAGRKKLRQAISMLKEKLEANEKVLQVNETLRQECEKERLRAEAERNRAEEEKSLREQLEKEGLSTNEQLVRVLQRLDGVERNRKADHNEFEQMRKKMEQAMAGLGGAVKAIEAAHSTFETLEKELLGKVSNVTFASTKSASLAETAIGDAKRAQGTAAAAEKLSESLVSRITALQKQGASLDQRLTLFQEEILKRQVEPPHSEPKSNGNGASNAVFSAAHKPRRGMVLSKNQQQASPRTGNKDWLSEVAACASKLTRAEGKSSVLNGAKPADTEFLSTCGSLSLKLRTGSEGAGFYGRESLPDDQATDKALREMSSAPGAGQAAQDKTVPDSSRVNIVREALNAAKERRKLHRPSSSNKLVLQPGKSSSCLRSPLGTLTSNGTQVVKEYPVSGEELRGRLLVDSSSGSVPALLENGKNSYVSHRTDSTRGTNVGDHPELRPCITKKLPRTPVDNDVETKLVVANPLRCEKEMISVSPESEAKISKNRRKGEKLPVALLKDITKLFLKEKKSHEKVEKKLAALQKVLQTSEADEFGKPGLGDRTLENCKKRKRRESLKDQRNTRACVRGAEQSLEVARENVEVGTSKCNNIAIKDDPTSRLQPPANKTRHSDPRECGNAESEAGWKRPEIVKGLGPQISDVGPASPVLDSLAAAPDVIEPCQEMDINTEDVCRAVTGGWDSDSERSEDEMGEDWWAQKPILLSPTLPIVRPPSSPFEGQDSDAPLRWAAASDINLEDFSLFLDVLPPIDQEICDEDMVVPALPHISSSNPATEELQTESGLTAPDGQRNTELQRGSATEPSSNLLKSGEMSPSSASDRCLESGSLRSDNPGGRLEDEEREILIGGSFCDNSVRPGSPPKPPFCRQDISVGTAGKSEGVRDKLAIDSGARGDDVLWESNGTVKEEKVDAAQCSAREHTANLFSFTLELVVEDVAQERGVNCTASIMDQGSLGCSSAIPKKIAETFGRTRDLLQRTLNHSNDDAFGSSLAVAPDISSFFASSTLSKSDLMCIFTASLVDSHALWDHKNTYCFGSDCKTLQRLVDIVKQVLAAELFKNLLSPDQAFLNFAVQLQKFLIQGTIQAVCPRISGEALDGGCATEQTFHFATLSSKLQRLRALISGGKLLAIFCKKIGKLDFLRSSIYCVLRFCDMDNECLLAIISALACMGYVSLSSVDKDDVVGQAVRVVISELIHDAGLGRLAEASTPKKEEVEFRLEMLQGSTKEAERSADCTLLLESLRALRGVIGAEEDLSFQDFVPRVVELFHGVITATPGSHLIGNRHLFQRSLCKITSHKLEPDGPMIPNSVVEQSFKTCQATDETCTGMDGSSVREKDDERSPCEGYCWRDISVKGSNQPVSQSERDANVIFGWEQKFYDIANALELVASHLGWEWTYNDFIVEHLWKLVSPGAPSMTVACVAHLFGLLGRLGREVDSAELPGVDELRKSLLVVLSLDQASGSPVHDFSFTAQVAAAQALLVLSSSNRKDEFIPSKDPERVFSKSSDLHAKSVKSLWNWVQTSKPKIQEILPSSLRCALLSINEDNFVPIF